MLRFHSMRLPALFILSTVFWGVAGFAAGTPSEIEKLSFPDPELTRCVLSWAQDPMNQYQSPEEVHEIACANYGIKSLQGIEQLPALLVIDLSHNPIETYAPLKSLSAGLGFLWIWGNSMDCERYFQLRKELPRTWIGGFDISQCSGHAEAPTQTHKDGETD